MYLGVQKQLAWLMVHLLQQTLVTDMKENPCALAMDGSSDDSIEKMNSLFI